VRVIFKPSAEKEFRKLPRERRGIFQAASPAASAAGSNNKGSRGGFGRTLQDGELAAAFDGFEPLIARDGVERDGRVFSQLLARRR
jgi:hypothetical protein